MATEKTPYDRKGVRRFIVFACVAIILAGCSGNESTGSGSSGIGSAGGGSTGSGSTGGGSTGGGSTGGGSTGGGSTGTTYSLSGTVTQNQSALPGVTVGLTSGSSPETTTTTDASGYYQFANLAPNSYVITPSKAGYNFNPPSLTVTINNTNIAGQDFAGSLTPPSAAGPAILFTDVNSGPVTGGPNDHGIPISIFGKGWGTVRGSSTVTIGGVPVSDYLVWGVNNAHNGTLDMIVVQPGPAVQGGAIAVTVNGRVSNTDHSFTVRTGNIYYLSTSGRDSNNCSSSSPCQTIQHVAADVMQPGDTVLIRGGTYDEAEVWIRSDHGQSGSLGRPKVIKNYPGEEVYYSNADRPFLLDADYITVSGLNFQNGKSLGIATWASPRQKGNWLINNTFQGEIQWDAINVGGDDHIVAGNTCNVAASTVGTQGHCYYISQANNVKLLYNVGSGAPGYGIHIYDQRRATPDFRRVISNILVEGNLLKSSPERSGLLIGIDDEGSYGNMIDGIVIRNNIFTANNFVGIQFAGSATLRNIKVYNNTFYQNGRQGINIPDLASIANIDIRNNLIYQSANSICLNNCDWFTVAHIEKGSQAQNISVTGNSYHPGSPNLIGITDGGAVTGAVQFANAAALDFHIQSGSAVIDRGALLTDVPRDYDGTSRPQGAALDIGAFEYTGN